MKAPDNDVNKLSEESDELAIKLAREKGILSGAPLTYFIDGFNTMKQLTAASNKTAAGMRWVKCSERLPEKELGNVILKFLGNAWYGHFENHDEGGRMMYIPTKGLYYGRDTWINAEWLDEDSPASGKWTDKMKRKVAQEAYNHMDRDSFIAGAEYLLTLLNPSAGERETVKK